MEVTKLAERCFICDLALVSSPEVVCEFRYDSNHRAKSSPGSGPNCSSTIDTNAERELLLRRSGDLTGPFSDEVLLSLGVCEFNKLTFGIPKAQVTPHLIIRVETLSSSLIQA